MTEDLFGPYYLADNDVSPAQDAQLISLLSTCFIGPEDDVFMTRRWFKQAPAHRWIMLDKAGTIRAHLAAHDKTIACGGNELRIAGTAEVCTHPDWQGRGMANRLLAAFHDWCGDHGKIEFSLHFGPLRRYASKGYQSATNSFHYYDDEAKAWADRSLENALWKPFLGQAWPDGPVDLRGPLW